MKDVTEHVTEYSPSGAGPTLGRLARNTPYVDRRRASADGGGVMYLYCLTAAGEDKHEELFE